jgi:hypothetical protein
MTPDQQLCRLLDDTTAALAAFDLESLHTLIEQAEALQLTRPRVTKGNSVAATKQRILAATITATASNIRVLQRLRSGESARQWGH